MCVFNNIVNRRKAERFDWYTEDYKETLLLHHSWVTHHCELLCTEYEPGVSACDLQHCLESWMRKKICLENVLICGHAWGPGWCVSSQIEYTCTHMVYCTYSHYTKSWSFGLYTPLQVRTSATKINITPVQPEVMQSSNYKYCDGGSYSLKLMEYLLD